VNPTNSTRQLDVDSFHVDLNDVAYGWCESSAPAFGFNLDAGTPGAANLSCGLLACGLQEEAGDLDAADPVYNRATLPGCTLSPLGTAVSYETWEWALIGAGPHDLTADLCGAATFDSVLGVYQAPDGARFPFDPAAPCDNLLFTSDDAAECGDATSYLAATGLASGFVEVIVTSATNGELGTYDLSFSSTTAPCTGEFSDPG